MYIEIGTVDGKTHYSQPVTEQELMDEINAVDGRIGSGEYADVVINSVEEFIEFFDELVKYNSKYETQVFSLNIGNGKTRKFNVRHIIWWQVNRDDPEDI